MEKSAIKIQVYECKECSYTTSYEHYLERHTKTHGKNSRAHCNTSAAVTNKTLQVEQIRSDLGVQPDRKENLDTIETLPIKLSGSLS